MSDTPPADSTGPSGSSPDSPKVPDVGAAPSDERTLQPLRVWPSLVIVPATIVAILLTQVVLAVIFALLYVAGGASPAEIPSLLVSDVRFIVVSLSTSQLTLMCAAIVGGRLSPEPFAARLGLSRPNAPLWSMVPIFIGTAFVWALVVTAWPYVFPEPSDTIVALSEMITELGRTNPLLLITMIAILPPICEELLVRGYVLRRVTMRWGPLVGIGLSTLAFAVLHIDPQHAIGVIPLGLWAGFVAWRTGSVYPAILCHAANNGCAVMVVLSNPNMVTMDAAEEVSSDVSMPGLAEVLPVSIWLFMLITGACFAVSVFVLMRYAKPTWRIAAASSVPDDARPNPLPNH